MSDDNLLGSDLYNLRLSQDNKIASKNFDKDVDKKNIKVIKV